MGSTKIGFMQANQMTKIEFLAGEPGVPSWWLDVYTKRGMEVGSRWDRPSYAVPSCVDAR